MLSNLSKKFVSLTASPASTSNGNGPNNAESHAESKGSKDKKLPPLDTRAEEALRLAGIPLVSCQECPAPCDPSHPTATASELLDEKLLKAWSKQDIDNTSTSMFPSNAPFLRHVLVSTGKRDWPHDVASVKGSLANLFSQWAEGEPKRSLDPSDDNGYMEEPPKGTAPVLPAGCWRTTSEAAERPSRLLIGNSSQVSSSQDQDGQSVMLLPDYQVLCNVRDATGSSSSATARSAYQAFISPSSTSTSNESTAALRSSRRDGVRRYVLPYKAIVILCSHKKRDARCGISAPLLADVFRRHAEASGWEIDERGDEIGQDAQGDLEDEAGTLEWNDDGTVKNRGWGYIHEDLPDSSSRPSNIPKLSPQAQSLVWRRSLSSLPSSASSSSPPPPHPTLLLLYTSHIGKHKYAGNVLLYFPNEAGVWYGRVSPTNGSAGQIWNETILNGRVISEFLRLGMNLWRGESEEEEEEEGEEEENKGDSPGSSGKRLVGRRDGGSGILRW